MFKREKHNLSLGSALGVIVGNDEEVGVDDALGDDPGSEGKAVGLGVALTDSDNWVWDGSLATFSTEEKTLASVGRRMRGVSAIST